MHDNNLREWSLLRHQLVASTLRLPATNAGLRANSERSLRQPHLDVHLVPTHPPIGTLEVAPRSALRENSAREQWDGFWCVEDDRYYARCTRLHGGVQWFRIADGRALILIRSAG